MNVLSLFDGMSCGQIALKELKFDVVKYYASEIDKFAIQQTQYNFPNTIQLGDVTMIGAGAGKRETGYALLTDILAINSRYV